jgi:CSLREA domain-containing protein
MIAHRIAAAAFALVSLLGPMGNHLFAETIKVTTVRDDAIPNGNCTLREALMAANTDSRVDACVAGAGADRIIVPAGTYVLSLVGPREDGGLTGDLDVASDVTIRGSQSGLTIVDGGSLDDAWADRVFDVRSTGRLVLSFVTVQGGFCFGGAGLLNAGVLTISDSVVRNNIASEAADFCSGAPGGGAGVYNTGTLTILRSMLTDNDVHGVLGFSDVAYPGGAVLNRGIARIDGSALLSNFAAGGAGIWNDGDLEVRDTDISGNSARFWGAGIENDGLADISRSTIGQNGDGGILNHTRAVSLQNVTLSGNNSARVAGAVHNFAGTVSIVNSTVAANVGSRAPNCDMAPCPPPVAGIGGAATVTNTIVSNPGYGDCWEPVVSLGNNISGDGTCGFMSFGDIPDTDPRLGPLADNGGPTPTHALLPDSPARDHVPTHLCAVATDQRGVPRPQPNLKFSQCDVGAYEFGAFNDLVSRADLGNPADEALHQLEGWGAINPGLLPPEIDADRTSRYQLLRGVNALTLAVPLPGIGHTLRFRTEDGVCDDSFDVYLDGVRIYSYRAETTSATFFPLHEVELSGSQLAHGAVRIGFVNTAADSCGLAAVYFVSLTAVLRKK